MNPGENNRGKQKVVASCILIFSVVIIALVVNGLSNENKNIASTSSSITSGGAASGPATTTTTSSSTVIYKDGSYTASDSYATPGGSEHISVKLTIKANAVSAVSLQQNANNRDSRDYQDAFEQSYRSYVVGKALNSINISRVSGASLTTGGFNAALEQIKSQAQQA